MDGETPDARVGGIRYGSCCVLRQVERLSLHAVMLNHRSEKILLTRDLHAYSIRRALRPIGCSYIDAVGSKIMRTW